MTICEVLVPTLCVKGQGYMGLLCNTSWGPLYSDAMAYTYNHTLEVIVVVHLVSTYMHAYAYVFMLFDYVLLQIQPIRKDTWGWPTVMTTTKDMM